MAHTYCFRCLLIVFSRPRSVRKPSRAGVSRAFVGVVWEDCARKMKLKDLAVGGTDDPCPYSPLLPSSVAIAEAMQKIKGGSVAMAARVLRADGVEWQQGYGAFSIGWSQVDATVKYIGRAAGAPSKARFPGGVFGDFEAASDGIRCAVCVGLIHAGPTGRRGMRVDGFPGFTRGYFRWLPPGAGHAAG